MKLTNALLCAVLLWASAALSGQTRGTQTQDVELSLTNGPVANVIERNVRAVNYRVNGGDTKLAFKGTTLLPEAKGNAEVESKKGYVEIKAEFEKLGPPAVYGPEYLTYVLWAVTPEGRATNLGELVLSSSLDKDSKLEVTTELQAFGLIVTAEPYFAVVRPSDTVIMENFIHKDSNDTFEMDAKVVLLKRGEYIVHASAAELTNTETHHEAPLELAEARNAVRIAAWAGADRKATDAMQRAKLLLAQAEVEHKQGSSKKTSTLAREAVQTAEDARLLTLKKIEEARVAAERQEAVDRELAATAKAERESRLRAEADRARMQADTAQRLEMERRASAEAAERVAKEKADLARLEAERVKAQAEERGERERAERARLEADRSRIAAESRLDKERAEGALREAERAREDAARSTEEARRASSIAEEARLAADRAEKEKAELRMNLARQLNLILETRETARGLIVSMSDVLFDTAQYSLRPGAREKLAKVSGILLAYPGLSLQIEGHTDNVGSDDYNQILSDHRAGSVRDFLVQQGISPFTITARGFGENQPVASNDSPEGRQRNRRVELVVSGETIGKPISALIK